LREYGKVFSQFWGSDDMKSLSEDGRTLALYLLTCQHGTIAGVFPLPDGYASEDIGWTHERVAKGFDELSAKGFANRCVTTKWVWIRKHFDWNRPENPNQWKAVRKIADRVPEKTVWKPVFLEELGIAAGDDYDDPPEPLKNPSPTLPKPVSVSETVTEGKKAARKARSTRISDEFVLTPDLSTYATTQLPDCDPDQTFAKFREQALAKGWEYVDWAAAFRTYCRNARKDSGHFGAGQYPRRTAINGGIHAGVVMR
jgi:hypothetical protein